MDRVNIRIHIPQLLRGWNIKEFNRIKMDPGALKSGRRATIRKGELTTEAGSKRDVVVKLVNQQYALRSSDPERRLKLLVEYFKRESRIWTSLGAHPNLVPLLGFIPTLQTQAFPSLVMPFYSSGDLRNFVNEGNVSLKVKLQLMRDVANGLHYMHSRKPPAIHRDLKASNILIETVASSAKEKYRARIADFGSTKLFEMENEVQITGGTSAPVSMPWTPPEYVKRSDTTDDVIIDYSHPTCAGDIWSFGCTFLEVRLPVIIPLLGCNAVDRYFKKLIRGVIVLLVWSFCKEGVLRDQKVVLSMMTAGR
ncbi:hypothetical protein ACEPAF_125 [Sanghuangporus sanghuang]